MIVNERAILTDVDVLERTFTGNLGTIVIHDTIAVTMYDQIGWKTKRELVMREVFSSTAPQDVTDAFMAALEAKDAQRCEGLLQGEIEP